MRHFLIAAFAAALPFAGFAQEPNTDTVGDILPGAATEGQEITNGQVFGDWTVRCQALGVNRTRCMLGQRITRSEGGGLLVELLAFWSDETPAKPILISQVPVGVHLPSGFALQPEEGDDDERLDYVWQACSPTICEAAVVAEDGVLEQLAQASQVLAGYRPATGAEPVVFPISTTGLIEGLEALKPATE